MLILDTNVISALMMARPDATIVDWMNGAPADSVWLTTITIFEVRFGLAALPNGRKLQRLEDAFDAFLHEDFGDRILDFDFGAATASAAIAAARRKLGRPVEIRDTMIAGIALARKATLVTRNTRDFTDGGVLLINPWSAAD